MHSRHRTSLIVLAIAIAIQVWNPLPSASQTPEPDQTDTNASEDLTGSQLSDDEREQMLNTRQEWRDTLLYGIKSEILELFPTLIETQESELEPDVIELFESSNDSEILAASAEFLTTIESTAGHARAQELLQAGDRTSAGLPVILMNYLRETEAELEEATVESLFEIAISSSTRDADAAVRLLG
ncbi:MAG TPA: hypothetical protein VJ932_06015, partial [Alkalispirochaeta sp.]|nr:hypothetical protein [Alkalispirochaeta sp.]